MQAAAKKFEERSSRGQASGDDTTTQGERQKQRRDKMAARHLQREKEREVVTCGLCVGLV